jgi:hypothetical protein
MGFQKGLAIGHFEGQDIPVDVVFSFLVSADDGGMYCGHDYFTSNSERTVTSVWLQPTRGNVQWANNSISGTI